MTGHSVQTENEVKKRKKITTKRSKKVKILKASTQQDPSTSTEKIIPHQYTPNPEDDCRTIFVGNLPMMTTRESLRKLFQPYGKIESTRLRGITASDPKMPKKVAAIKRDFHPKRNSILGYVKFVDSADAVGACALNGVLFNSHHLRIQVCNENKKYDESRAIFVGNLSFEAEENDLWDVFKKCGEIESVRLIRDSVSGFGKGFAYVNFASADGVHLALLMKDVKIKDRILRISICTSGGKNKKLKRNETRQKEQVNLSSEINDKKKKKKKIVDTQEADKVESKYSKKKKQRFQGQKYVIKKKKSSKGDPTKKRLKNKIIEKSK